MSSQANMWRVLSIGVFILCLLMPGYSAEGKNYYGWFLLLFGFYGLPSGDISWLANIALVASWMTFTNTPRFVPLACAIGAIVLALTFAVKDTAWSYNWTNAEADFMLRAGYYVWVLSIGLAAIAALKNLTGKPD